MPPKDKHLGICNNCAKSNKKKLECNYGMKGATDCCGPCRKNVELSATCGPYEKPSSRKGVGAKTAASPDTNPIPSSSQFTFQINDSSQRSISTQQTSVARLSYPTSSSAPTHSNDAVNRAVHQQNQHAELHSRPPANNTPTQSYPGNYMSPYTGYGGPPDLGYFPGGNPIPNLGDSVAQGRGHSPGGYSSPEMGYGAPPGRGYFPGGYSNHEMRYSATPSGPHLANHNQAQASQAQPSRAQSSREQAYEYTPQSGSSRPTSRGPAGNQGRTSMSRSPTRDRNGRELQRPSRRG